MRYGNQTHLRFLGLTLAVVLALSLAAGFGCGGSGTSKPFVSKNVAVSMRDGIGLRTKKRDSAGIRIVTRRVGWFAHPLHRNPDSQ